MTAAMAVNAALRHKPAAHIIAVSMLERLPYGGELRRKGTLHTRLIERDQKPKKYLVKVRRSIVCETRKRSEKLFKSMRKDQKYEKSGVDMRKVNTLEY